MRIIGVGVSLWMLGVVVMFGYGAGGGFVLPTCPYC
jgi:hypothetical protein